VTLPSSRALRLVGLTRGRERFLAEASHAEECARFDRDVQADEARFRTRMAEVERLQHVVLGKTDTGTEYRITLRDLTSLPAHVTAATGAGKSRFVGSFMARIVSAIVRGEPVSIAVADGKWETADQFLRSVAHVAEGLRGRRREDFLSRLYTFRFFDKTYLPSWPLLAKAAGVDIATQADAVAEVLSEIVADAMVGPRQRSMLSAILALAIEFGVPAVALPWLLNAPNEVAALAARSSLPLVRLDLSRFEREPQGSIDGLIARLGILLRSSSLKAVLSGATPFDFATCFEPGRMTAFDFGGAELGARAGVRAMGSLAISALANAAFDPRREVRGTTIIVVDEPNAFLTSVSLGQFERLITLGRSFGAGGVMFVHQGPTQLPQEFQSLLSTNVALRVLGRSGERDALAASEWLPRTGRVPRPREPGVRPTAQGKFMSEGQEERFRIAQIGRLPARSFVVADRRMDFAPRIVRAPDFDPPAWSDIQADVRDAVLRGTVGVPRHELDARVHAIEAQAAARLDARSNTANLETPNVVGLHRRPRRGAP
jgi:hypothetical protein